ncbi:uncharacterized protein LOC121847415 [Oncorhynchus tshawytscha]|uniref:uncharacterized protein LOC121847415 n=1 Tax=Oncorhynchus tshawytscha TaxID=74940 RepID=UPI001C3CD5F0|nr:uncharacterized protein LOC121847415 [Oncorhynchus tshawytscha]
MALCTARQISTMAWKATGVLIVFLLALVAESTLSLPTFMTVILNEPITLPFSGLCRDGVIEWRRYQDGPSGGIIKKTVAELDRGVLTSGEGYENRVELQNGNLSLTISSAEYNDMGWYECVCNNNTNVLHDVKLEVLVPTKISAHVGENVTLHCHGITASEINFHWQKDVQMSVLKVEAGHTTFDPGFEDRASVSKDGYSKGDLSLTLTNITLSDRGTYQYFVGPDKQTRGNPEAVTLTITVQDKPSEDTGTWSPWIEVVLAVMVVLIVIGLVFCVGLWSGVNSPRCLSPVIHLLRRWKSHSHTDPTYMYSQDRPEVDRLIGMADFRFSEQSEIGIF